ncbi:MAG: glycosyltransferase [Bacilli bacterium]|nr:glycosyltransferase [Bacilli bacterium]
MNKKLKIYVYAICKNEEEFVKRWVDSMSEADGIYVLDTGSTDNTVEKLKEKGVNVETKIISPWRFDVARNESLKLIPEDADICVCTDLDEVFVPGWRKILEESWVDDATKARYTYNWSLDDQNKPIVSFFYEKTHTLKDYKWTHPVHEVLTFIGEKEKILTIPDITLNHYPDRNKSRSSYLPLLELSVEEDPDDDRNMHYLGREYMYYGRWNECIDTLIKHLKLPKATWKDERSASMRFIARSYTALKRYDEAIMWLDKAIEEAPYLRDPLIDKAILMYTLENWDELEKLVLKALEIPINGKTYINEVFTFNETPYDLLSLAYYNKKDKENALENVSKAIEINPNDERLRKNYEYILKMK